MMTARRNSHPPTKEKAKDYSLSSRFILASETVDDISCHHAFADTAQLYITCHQIKTMTPTQAANDIAVVQWKTLYEQILVGPTTPFRKQKYKW